MAYVGSIGDSADTDITAMGDVVNVTARLSSVAAAGEILVTSAAAAAAGLPADLPRRSLQLKGKSAETFRVLKVTAIREDKTSPWVPMPTEAATAAYSAKQDLYTTQSAFA